MSPHQRLGQREFEIACGLPAGSLDERTKALLEKPEYWDKVDSNNFRNVCFDKDGKLPARAQEFVERLRKEKVEMGDT